MLLFDGALGVLMFGLWLFCIIDVITTPDGSVRNLPKLVWLFIVILLPDVGSIAWLVAGRNWNGGTANLPYKGNAGSRPRRTSGPAAAPVRTRATNPDDDDEFLAGLKARAEEQRRRARETEGDGPTAGAAE